MISSGPFPEKFAFLNDLRKDVSSLYQGAPWLKSPYDSSTWSCQLDDEAFKIDFRVELEDSSLLTAPKNRTLLNTLKSWLCIQGHPPSNGYVLNAPITTRRKITAVLQIIDYLLLNSKKFGLARFGLEALTADDIKDLLHKIATGSRIEFCIYEWRQRLRDFLTAGIRSLTDEEIRLHLDKHPRISEIRNDTQDTLGFESEQLVLARIYLWRNHFYTLSNDNSDYRFNPNVGLLVDEIYPNVLCRCNPRSPEELCFGWRANFELERISVPVKNWQGDLRSRSSTATYVAAVRSLGLLTPTALPVPHWALAPTADRVFIENLPKRKVGRYRTLPYEVVSKSLRDSIEFILKYGKDLVESFLRLAKAATQEGLKHLGVFCSRNDIANYLTDTVRNMGVRYWCLRSLVADQTHLNINSIALPQDLQPSVFFCRFRANEGLFELLEVLYGAVQICVGTVMARRQGELNDLDAKDALDVSRSHLIFHNRKTGAYGRRVRTARPIPKIASDAIGLIQELQQGLIELGIIEKLGKLFAMPHCAYLDLNEEAGPYRYLNRFCDYFEMQLDHLGHRYYLRQHQLRRNFAMMFFWGASFGGVETLQWFLGHSDPEQLYNYITEEMPGSALVSAKAAHAANMILRESPEVSALGDLIEQHFGTRSFSVLDYEELEDYLTELLTEERVTIEPQFFTVGRSKQYRILVVVKEQQ